MRCEGRDTSFKERVSPEGSSSYGSAALFAEAEKTIPLSINNNTWRKGEGGGAVLSITLGSVIR